jgi:hypothetical protein
MTLTASPGRTRISLRPTVLLAVMLLAVVLTWLVASLAASRVQSPVQRTPVTGVDDPQSLVGVPVTQAPVGSHNGSLAALHRYGHQAQAS